MKITTVGIDLAKSVLTVHGVDEHGKMMIRKTVRRAKLLELFAQSQRIAVREASRLRFLDFGVG